ncbi:MAG: hypothetical protein KDC75_16295, partial [Phaeodactylibacter sp.]|nr:hypothetical protein [Phaeodactylibacter sp.]
MQTITAKTYTTIDGLTILGKFRTPYTAILSKEAQQFLLELHRRFNARRQELLARREERQQEINLGKMPDFLPETKHIRDSEWMVAPLPADLLDRRVEITGPVDRKMV